MTNCLFFIIVLFLLYMLSNHIKCTLIDGLTLKSGDLLAEEDVHGRIKTIHLIYKDKALFINSRGFIEQKSVESIVKNSPYDVYAFELGIKLTPLQHRTFASLVTKNYAGLGNVNCVFNTPTKQYFFKCPTYIVNIMSKVGIITTGLDYDCLNHSDPKCFQAFYDTSVYINKILYPKTPYLLKVR